MTPTQFLERLMALAGRFRFRVTSYYRSPQSNTDAGGVDDSLHQYWLAADIMLEDPTQSKDFAYAANRLGLIAIIEPDHIHLQAP